MRVKSPMRRSSSLIDADVPAGCGGDGAVEEVIGTESFRDSASALHPHRLQVIHGSLRS
jgi:hypothetical protein